jgi:hypothetical protein
VICAIRLAGKSVDRVIAVVARKEERGRSQTNAAVPVTKGEAEGTSVLV